MKNLTTMGAGQSVSAQLGEPPGYDRDLGTDRKKYTRGIRRQVLKGLWPAEDRHEEQMIRDFKASKMGVDEFLKIWSK